MSTFGTQADNHILRVHSRKKIATRVFDKQSNFFSHNTRKLFLHDTFPPPTLTHCLLPKTDWEHFIFVSASGGWWCHLVAEKTFNCSVRLEDDNYSMKSLEIQGNLEHKSGSNWDYEQQKLSFEQKITYYVALKEWKCHNKLTYSRTLSLVSLHLEWMTWFCRLQCVSGIIIIKVWKFHSMKWLEMVWCLSAFASKVNDLKYWACF